MGGYIKVVIRFGDGTIHADTYGTNALPFWVCHPKTIMGDESTMRRYIQACTTWNNGDRTYTPVEYGVFVVDFQTKTMLSANDYSHCDSSIMDRVMMIAQRLGAEKPDGEDENGYTIFDEMLYRGFVSLRRRWRSRMVRHRCRVSSRRNTSGRIWHVHQRIPGAPSEIVSIPGIRAQHWDEKVYEVYRKKYSLDMTFEQEEAQPDYDIVFGYPGWTRHCETDRGVEAQDRLRARLRELGFPFDATNEATYAVWKGRETLEAQ